MSDRHPGNAPAVRGNAAAHNGNDPATRGNDTATCGNDAATQIEAALEALRQARPPDGMEARLVAALQSQPPIASRLPLPVAPAAPAGWLGLRGGWGWSGLATAASLSLILFFAQRHHSAVTSVSQSAAQPVSQSAAGGQQARAAATPAGRSAATETAPQLLRAEAPARLSRPTLQHALAISKAAGNEVGNAAENAAGVDATTPSFPAPPAPLTRQEQLLLRIARSGAPIEMAMLDPALRDARTEQEKADVGKFFAEAPRKEEAQ